MDEVGRGALAGPVTVGVVLIERDVADAPPGVRDSKLLSPARRVDLIPQVTSWCRSWAVGHASSAEIDDAGIIEALRLAGTRALAMLDPAPDLVLLDGSHDWLTPPPATLFAGEGAGAPVPVVTKVRADLQCAAVAAASILAKVARDDVMTQAAASYPAFNWERNKGYGSTAHRRALQEHGPTPLHRVSWRLTSTADG